MVRVTSRPDGGIERAFEREQAALLFDDFHALREVVSLVERLGVTTAEQLWPRGSR